MTLLGITRPRVRRVHGQWYVSYQNARQVGITEPAYEIIGNSVVYIPCSDQQSGLRTVAHLREVYRTFPIATDYAGRIG